MERITVHVTWVAEDGTLETLENEGGDGTLVRAALEAFETARDSGAESFDVHATIEREV